MPMLFSDPFDALLRRFGTGDVGLDGDGGAAGLGDLLDRTLGGLLTAGRSPTPNNVTECSHSCDLHAETFMA